MNEDVSPCIAIQIVISQLQMDPAEDRIVEVCDLISREKEDSMEVFKLAKEHADKPISIEVQRIALLQKYIGFIQQEERVPLAGILKDLRKLCL